MESPDEEEKSLWWDWQADRASRICRREKQTDWIDEKAPVGSQREHLVAEGEVGVWRELSSSNWGLLVDAEEEEGRDGRMSNRTKDR